MVNLFFVLLYNYLLLIFLWNVCSKFYIFIFFIWLYLCVSIPKCRASQPLILSGLLAYYTDGPNNGDLELAYIYACGLVLTSFVRLLLYYSITFEVLHCGMKMRVACCSVMFNQVYIINAQENPLKYALFARYRYYCYYVFCDEFHL